MLIAGRLRLIIYRLERSSKSGRFGDICTAYIKALPGLRKLVDRARSENVQYSVIYYIENSIQIISQDIQFFADHIETYTRYNDYLIKRYGEICNLLRLSVSKHYSSLNELKKYQNRTTESKFAFYINPGQAIKSNEFPIFHQNIPISAYKEIIDILDFGSEYIDFQPCAEYEIPEDIAQELLDDGYELPPEIMENLQDRQQSDRPHHEDEELEEGKKVVRITFMTEVYIEGGSYDEIRAKWEEMPLYSYYSNCNFIGVTSCENAETMGDCMSDVFA